MKRLTYLLFTVGAVLAVVAVRTYSEARDEHNYQSALCAIGGNCTAAMSWQPTIALAALAAAVVAAGLLVAKRTKDLVD